MFLAFKLAYRNLVGAGLRTWLNVIVLSFSYVVIIWLKGLMVGWDHQARVDMEKWQIAKGQYWHHLYDQYNPFSLTESHAPVPERFLTLITEGAMVPVLVVQASLYPHGRMQPILLKGIPKNQNLLKLPVAALDTISDAIPAIIGTNMARSAKLEKGDRVVLRWRDKSGTFDAAELVVTDIFATNVPAIDGGQVWIDLENLRQMMLLPNEATYLNFGQGVKEMPLVEAFVLKTQQELTSEIDVMIKTKTTGQSVFYIILLLLAMLAIFDTQVLSIFRRQKEIGTYVALGYTRQQVVGLFTIEGAMHAVLAAAVAAVYGVPFFIWQSHAGFTIPMDSSDYGIAMAQTMYPVFTVGLIVSTTLIVLITTAVVSYWPSRRIAQMNPTEALRGKIQ